MYLPESRAFSGVPAFGWQECWLIRVYKENIHGCSPPPFSRIWGAGRGATCICICIICKGVDQYSVRSPHDCGGMFPHFVGKSHLFGDFPHGHPMYHGPFDQPLTPVCFRETFGHQRFPANHNFHLAKAPGKKNVQCEFLLKPTRGKKTTNLSKWRIRRGNPEVGSSHGSAPPAPPAPLAQPAACAAVGATGGAAGGATGGATEAGGATPRGAWLSSESGSPTRHRSCILANSASCGCA